MAIVSMAMTLSFHLKQQPTALERQIAKPLGAIFWVLAVLTLAVGISNYIRACSFSPPAEMVSTALCADELWPQEPSICIASEPPLCSLDGEHKR